MQRRILWSGLALVLVIGGCGSSGSRHDDHDATVSHRFDDVERWVERFDDPERDDWQRPADVIAFLDLQRGDTAVDIGAGTGYFAVRLGRAVGPEGRVFAVDIEPGLVEYMKERAARDEVPWVEPVLTEPEDPGVPDGSADVVLIVNTWHHINDRLEYLRRLATKLKPGGRLVVVDYREGDLPVGPPAGHKLPAEHVLEELEEAGWKPAGSLDDLPYQYVLAFTP